MAWGFIISAIVVVIALMKRCKRNRCQRVMSNNVNNQTMHSMQGSIQQKISYHYEEARKLEGILAQENQRMMMHQQQLHQRIPQCHMQHYPVYVQQP